MALKTHGRVSLQVYLPMVGVFTDQVNTNYIVGAALLKHQQWRIAQRRNKLTSLLFI
jgi:hypothetical protein